MSCSCLYSTVGFVWGGRSWEYGDEEGKQRNTFFSVEVFALLIMKEHVCLTTAGLTDVWDVSGFGCTVGSIHCLICNCHGDSNKQTTRPTNGPICPSISVDMLEALTSLLVVKNPRWELGFLLCASTQCAELLESVATVLCCKGLLNVGFIDPNWNFSFPAKCLMVSNSVLDLKAQLRACWVPRWLLSLFKMWMEEHLMLLLF